jgi:hypothetical protein
LISNTFKRSAAVAVIFAASIAAHAQRNTVEVAAGGGYSYLDTGRVGIEGYKNHGTMDASVSYNVLKNLSAGFEYAFTPLHSETVGTSNGNATGSVDVHNYGAVVRVGLFKAKALMPYVSVTGGGLDLKFSAKQGNLSGSQSFKGGYLGAGVGMNAYLGHGFGVRPEFRYERQQLKDSAQNYDIFAGNGRNQLNLTGSLFYTFGRSHR